jgi:hypothetical protein
MKELIKDKLKLTSDDKIIEKVVEVLSSIQNT